MGEFEKIQLLRYILEDPTAYLHELQRTFLELVYQLQQSVEHLNLWHAVDMWYGMSPCNNLMPREQSLWQKYHHLSQACLYSWNLSR